MKLKIKTLSLLRSPFFTLHFFLFIALVMVSCSGDNVDADRFSLNQLSVGTTIDVAGQATTGVTVPVEANCQWTVTADAAWIHITSPKAGQGNGTENIVFDVDGSSLPVRQTGQLTIICSDGIQRVVTISQRAGDVRLAVAPNALFFTCEGGEQTMEVTANSQWTMSCSASWLRLDDNAELTAEGNRRITVRAETNTAADGQQAVITLRDVDDAVAPIIIPVELGGRTPQLTVTPPSDAAATGGITQLNLRSNFNWEAAIMELQPTSTMPWAFFEGGKQIQTGTAGIEVQTVSITVEPNVTDQPRFIVVNVKTLSNLGGNVERQYTITQEAGIRPVVYEPAVSGITMTDATVFFTATTTSLPIIERGVLYSTDEASVQTGTRITSTEQADDVTLSVSSLAPGTTYYLCAFATNAVGTSFSRVISFKTRSTPNRNGHELPD